MRRDLCYYYEKSFKEVYDAYVSAAGSKFGKDCRKEGAYCIGFGLNYSFKYNMNGGSCTVRFMPYKNGTAVNLRYSIAQAMGARYGAHARDLNECVAQILGSGATEEDIDVEEFVRFGQSAPAPALESVKPQETAKDIKFCSNCGKQNAMDAKFCIGCGNAFEQKPICSGCGRSFEEGEAFCPVCGTKKA